MNIIVKPPRQRRQASRLREQRIQSRGEGKRMKAIGVVGIPQQKDVQIPA